MSEGNIEQHVDTYIRQPGKIVHDPGFREVYMDDILAYFFKGVHNRAQAHAYSTNPPAPEVQGA